MKIQNLSRRIEEALIELNEEKTRQLIDEVEEFFRESFSELKTVGLNNEDALAFERCMLFVEFYKIHVGKSQSLVFVLLDMIENDRRFVSSNYRLMLMDCPTKVGDIRSQWRHFLAESVKCIDGVCKSPGSTVISNEMSSMFFERSVVRVFSSFRQMLLQVNEAQDFIPFLFQLMMMDGIVSQELAMKLITLSSVDENPGRLIDIFRK